MLQNCSTTDEVEDVDFIYISNIIPWIEILIRRNSSVEVYPDCSFRSLSLEAMIEVESQCYLESTISSLPFSGGHSNDLIS